MTGPVNLADLVPTKYKPFVGLLGSVLSFAVPYVIKVEDYLPSPWPMVIGLVLAALTYLGVYHAPYVPTGAVLAPDTPAVAAAARQAPPSGGHQSPWKK